MRIKTVGPACLVSMLCVPNALLAQSPYAASQEAIDRALEQHVMSANGDRDRVLRLLDRPEIRMLMKDAGLDLRTARTAVATLDAEQLQTVAAHARAVEESIAGGQSHIRISTTLLIIGLLVLILIIVAA